MNVSVDIRFEENNAAFQGSDWERRRLLEEAFEFAARKVDEAADKGHNTITEASKPLVDLSGNTVGEVTVT